MVYRRRIVEKEENFDDKNRLPLLQQLRSLGEKERAGF
jgi:hypothetical protein